LPTCYAQNYASIIGASLPARSNVEATLKWHEKYLWDNNKVALLKK